MAFGKRPVMPMEPSTTMMIGAMARIGIVCEEMIQGMRLRSSVFTWTISTARTMPRREPKPNPSKCGGQGHPGVKEQAAPGGDRRVDDGLLQFDQDLVRRRQHGPLLLQRPKENLARAALLTGALEGIGHALPVHRDRCRIPERHDSQNHYEDRNRAALPRASGFARRRAHAQRERVSRHRNAPLSGLRGPGGRSSEIPASREFPACAPDPARRHR